MLTQCFIFDVCYVKHQMSNTRNLVWCSTFYTFSAAWTLEKAVENANKWRVRARFSFNLWFLSTKCLWIRSLIFLSKLTIERAAFTFKSLFYDTAEVRRTFSNVPWISRYSNIRRRRFVIKIFWYSFGENFSESEL